MYALLKQFNARIEQVIGIIIFILFAGMVIISFSQVITRYLEYPLYWSEELARYMAIWVAYLGAAYALRKHALARVEGLVLLLSDVNRRYLTILISLLVIAFALFLCFYGYNLTLRVMRQTSPAMFISMSFVYSCAPISGLLMLLFSTEHLLEQFNKKSEV